MLKVCVVVNRVLFFWCRMGYADGLYKQQYALNKHLKVMVGTTSYRLKYS
jgi:hypothetical protein